MSTVGSPLEVRIAALISAYADQASTDVDPVATTRLAARGSASDRWQRPVFTVAHGGLAFGLLILTLVAALAAGAIVAGAQPFRRDPADVLTGRVLVEPFVGLAPETAAPSKPERGKLIIAFYGRVAKIGNHFHRMWVFEDGRLVWTRDQRAPGEPIGVLEQRLTPSGVDLLRDRTVGGSLTGLGVHEPGSDETRWGSPGVLWGGLALAEGERIQDMSWGDPELPGLLAEPSSWIPASAWADERIGAYVPSRYAICGWRKADPNRWLDLLPESVRAVLGASGTTFDPAVPYGPAAECRYQVSPRDARTIAAELDEAGFAREVGEHSFSYRVGEHTLDLLPVLPHGEVVCECG